jgi:uncharacterized protein (DUF885 family)
VNAAAGWRALLPLAVACTLAACHKAPVTPAVDWAAERTAFIEADLRASPAFAVHVGRHEYDGQVGDFSRTGLEREVARLKAAVLRFGAIPDSALDAPQRFERQYLLQIVEGQLFWLDTVGQPFHDPVWYMEQLDPSVYVDRDYAPLATRLTGYLGQLGQVPRVLAQARANLQLPLPRPHVERAIDGLKSYATFFGADARQVFAPITDPVQRAALDAATTRAVAAVRDFAAWLQAQLPAATDDFALGADRFAQMLKATEGVTIPVAQIKAAGEADLARNRARLEAACARFLPRRPVADCIAKLRAHKSPDGPVAGAQRQLAELKAFLVAHDVVSIPGNEESRVAAAPAYQRGYGAYTIIPGTFEKKRDAVYYIEPPDPAWTRREQRDYVMDEATLLNTSVHEVWPGHFLQFLHANRSASPVGSLYDSNAYAEGWAHYAEELMAELGLREGDPEAAIAQAHDALLRDARLLSAIGLHTEGMTLSDSERLFRERAFQDAATARQQALRGALEPAYLNYTLGKLMIRRLREDWTATRGGRAAWKAFHDELLSHGSPPIPLLRRQMLGSDAGPLL